MNPDIPRDHRRQELLALPDRLAVPERLRLPEALQSSGVITTPNQLSLPDLLGPPGPWLTAVPDSAPVSVEPPLVGVGASTSTTKVPRPAIESADALAPEEEDEKASAPSRGLRIPRGLIVAALVGLLLVAVVDDDSDDRKAQSGQTQAQPEQGAPSPSSSSAGSALSLPSTSSNSAVGMPIPTGNAPVEPIRIVLSTTHLAVPSGELAELARWIRGTQHPATRVRILHDGRITQPLSADEVSLAAPLERQLGAAGRWLRRGARAGRRGVLVRLGAPAGGAPAGPGLRSVSITMTRAQMRTRRALAAEIARQIMVTSRQGDGGTTAP